MLEISALELKRALTWLESASRHRRAKGRLMAMPRRLDALRALVCPYSERDAAATIRSLAEQSSTHGLPARRVNEPLCECVC
jgi:hypothetical protein